MFKRKLNKRLKIMIKPCSLANVLIYVKTFKIYSVIPSQSCANQRSVVFYRQSYYHFYYLAQALRARGWDAVVVNLEPPNGPNALYYHGEDLNLYHEDERFFNANIHISLNMAMPRFKLMHFAGDGYLSFLS